MLSRNYTRTQQVNDLIQQELSWIFQRHIADPRLKGLTITYVQTSKDLRYSDIKITHLNSSIDATALLKVLKKAAPKMRYLLAKQLNLRITPHLRFQYDTFMNESTKLHAKIDQAIYKECAS